MILLDFCPVAIQKEMRSSLQSTKVMHLEESKDVGVKKTKLFVLDPSVKVLYNGKYDSLYA